MKPSVASDGLMGSRWGNHLGVRRRCDPCDNHVPTPTESCVVDHSCVAEEEGDEHGSLFEGTDSSDVILKLLRLAGLTSPHQIH